MLGEIKLFLGQINQMKHGIFLTKSKYVKVILKKFRMEDSKPTSTPMVTRNKLSNNDNTPKMDQTLTNL